MAVRQPRYSKEEFAQRGDLIYQTQIRPQVPQSGAVAPLEMTRGLLHPQK